MSETDPEFSRTDIFERLLNARAANNAWEVHDLCVEWARACDRLIDEMCSELGIDPISDTSDVRRQFGERALAVIYEDVNKAGDVTLTLTIFDVDSRAPRGMQRPLTASRTLRRAITERLTR